MKSITLQKKKTGPEKPKPLYPGWRDMGCITDTVAEALVASGKFEHDKVYDDMIKDKERPEYYWVEETFR